MWKKVSDVAAAIDLATAGMRSGEWDLFRGQVRAQWPVTSSAERLSDADREEAWRQFQRFTGWAQSINAMSKYVAESDWLWAVAQHYGIKSQFIDFTDDPRVAAFFACDTQEDIPNGQEAAIVCLNSQDFLKFWEGMKITSDSHDPPMFPRYPQLVHIDVENLWRLQKQHGCFLWNPIADIERFYDFDRIVFPFVKDHAVLPRHEEIYPVDQSELEKLLTHFFMNERLLQGGKALAKRGRRIRKLRISGPGYDVRSWLPGGIQSSKDWQRTERWSVRKIEHADDVLQPLTIEINPSGSLKTNYQDILSAFTPDFIEKNRDKAFAAFSVEVGAGGALISGTRDLIAGIRRQWNGMRTLPYSAAEISTSISRSIQLFELYRSGLQVEEAFGPGGFEVEIGSSDDGTGSYSRGAVTGSALIEACNPRFLSAARRRLGGDDASFAFMSLGLPARPWQRFTFSGLRRLMVEQLIPSQIVWRGCEEGDDALRVVVFFSPKELKTFGLP